MVHRYSQKGEIQPVRLYSEIFIVEEDPQVDNPISYKSDDKTRWFSIFGCCLLVLGVVGGLTYYGISLKNAVDERNRLWKQKNDHEDRNKSFIDRKCEQPNYISKNNKIFAAYSDGKIQEFFIKGVNWDGMETVNGLPLGLWDSVRTGTNLFEMRRFLKDNNFNAVRFPLSITSVLNNITPNKDLINAYSNYPLKANNYLELLSGLIRILSNNNIAIVLDFHNLSPVEQGGLWYSNTVTEENYISSLKILAKALCNGLHWNVVGLDLKNSPHRSTWGSNDKTTDWKIAAEKLGNILLGECPNWLVFVQGISSNHESQLGSTMAKFQDWEGAGLQNIEVSPLKLNVKNKIVYSPQYYTPSKQPQEFFYRDVSKILTSNTSELSDADLKQVVSHSMDAMFLNATTLSDSAVILASYGGIYGIVDSHPKKTSSRVLDIIVNKMVANKNILSGGFLWSLNPNIVWKFNPAENIIDTNYGLFDNSWRIANRELMKLLSTMDQRVTFLRCSI